MHYIPSSKIMKNLENKDKKRKGLTLSKEKTYQLVCTL